MSEINHSFIDVRGVFVDFRTKPGLFGFMSARANEAYSALRDITFQLPLGAQLTVYGHEGAGKSTLLRLLTGAIRPSRGRIIINGVSPKVLGHAAAGYVSPEESEPRSETGRQILTAFAATHKIPQAPARIAEVNDLLGLGANLHRPASVLSTSARLRLNLARAAISQSPLILLDDVADMLGGRLTAELINTLFAGRTVLAATRHTGVATELSLPYLLLHQGTLAHTGTLEDIATNVSAPRVVDVWIEGLRYDLLRQVRHLNGVLEARLIPATQFSGQRLRITLRSARYLPTLYDLISRAPLIEVKELPPSLTEIISRLP